MKFLLMAVAALLLSAGAAGAACPVALPFTLVNGTTADAVQVMANLNTLWSCGMNSANVAITGGSITNLTALSSLTNDGPITVPGTPLGTFGNSTSVTAHTIRVNATGDDTRDVVQSVINMPVTSSLTGGNAFAAYGQNNASGGGTQANPVGFYDLMISNASNNTTWGGNFNVTDGLIAGTPSGFTGQLLVGLEVDLQIDNATTGGSGFNIQMGHSTAQTGGFDAFALSPGSNSVAGVKTHFTHGFVCNDAATVNAGACLTIGAQVQSGTNISSQNMVFAYFDAGAVERSYNVAVNAGGQLVVQQSQGANRAVVNVDGTLAINQGGSYFVGSDQIIASGGAGLIDFAGGASLTSAVFANGASLSTITIGNGTSDVTVSGSLKYGTFSAVTCTNNGSINIKDSGGATRKVMICS